MAKAAWDYAEMMMHEKAQRGQRAREVTDESNSEMGIGDTEAKDGSNERPN